MINTYLTANCYHAHVNKKGQNQLHFRTGKRSGIWLTFSLAVGLHLLIMLLPVTHHTQDPGDRRAQIELQFSTIEKQPQVEPAPAQIQESPLPESTPEFTPPPATDELASQAEADRATPRPQPLSTRLVKRETTSVLDLMSEPEIRALTNTILTRQFITEEAVIDRLFGRPIAQEGSELQKEFHFPVRPDLISMLDKPLPDVPFEYTPDLVYFAYDPGVRGDLQRFWDVITPEFGWRTKYGTEVKCVLVLVLVGCGWK